MYYILYRLIFILLITVLVFPSCVQATRSGLTVKDKSASVPGEQAVNNPASQNFSSSIYFAGAERYYHVHLPSSYDKNFKWPLVIQLHGGGGTGKAMNGLTGFYALADAENFIVLSPDAIERNWNDGRGDLLVKSHIENVDDVGFISLLIDKMMSDFNVDTRKVYVTGISNGALMSHRLGCELADKIAAIAPVAGNFPYQLAGKLSPSRPMPVIIINGTDDPLVPYDGGYITFGLQKRGRVLSVDDTVSFWVKNNNCSGNPTIISLSDRTDDGTSVSVKKFSSCKNDADVILYTIQGGGHTWPGGLQYLPESIIGKTCREFNASVVIWQFFKEHPLR